MEHYVLIQWPDSQEVIDIAIKEAWSVECYRNYEIDNSYFVPVRRIEGMQRISRENIASHLMTYQLSLIGKTRVQILDEERWRFEWTLTRKQYKEFRGYTIPLIRKIFKCNRLKAEDSFDYFFQNFGLRIKG